MILHNPHLEKGNPGTRIPGFCAQCGQPEGINYQIGSGSRNQSLAVRELAPHHTSFSFEELTYEYHTSLCGTQRG